MSISFESFNENLLDKFDRIDDLPVSEEMLGAYLEGNLDPIEQGFVENSIESYPELSFIAEIEITPEEQILFDSGDFNNLVSEDVQSVQLDLVDSAIPINDFISLDDFRLSDLDMYINDQLDKVSDMRLIPDEGIVDDMVQSKKSEVTEDPLSTDSDLFSDITESGTGMDADFDSLI